MRVGSLRAGVRRLGIVNVSEVAEVLRRGGEE
jgi:hypothetical protein